MKKFLKVVAFALAFVTLTACNGKAGISDEDVYYTFTDSVGNEVVLTKRPERVAVLFSSYAEIWILSGGDVAITVGDSVTRNFADDSAVLVNDGAGLKIDMEALVSAQPDFVVVTADLSAQQEAAEKMKELGIACAVFREENIDDYLKILKIFTDINDTPDVYEESGIKVKNEIDTILNDITDRNFSYLFIRCGSGFSSTKAKTAEDHFACVILDQLGGENIAEIAGDLASELSLESVVAQQPDYIFIVPQGDVTKSREYMDSVLSKDGWSDLDAVKNGRVIYLDKELFNYKPNQKWGESYQVLAQLTK